MLSVRVFPPIFYISLDIHLHSSYHLQLNLAAQKYVLCTYNIERNQLTAARNITPGKRAPTVTSLEDNGWVAVQAMVERKKIATVMDDLTSIGASDILVTKIENSRTY